VETWETGVHRYTNEQLIVRLKRQYSVYEVWRSLNAVKEQWSRIPRANGKRLESKNTQPLGPNRSASLTAPNRSLKIARENHANCTAPPPRSRTATLESQQRFLSHMGSALCLRKTWSDFIMLHRAWRTPRSSGNGDPGADLKRPP
jgi:hypothetical protein